MTVDVEDYFQVSAFEKHIDRNQWDSLLHRVDANTSKILDVFAEHQIKATFFTLGWVAERYPQLVKRIVADGHELASHGYEHIRVTEQTPTQFRADIRKTKQLLEAISGQPVIGYRAASYSIGAKNLWALQILEDEGFEYSSSIYPVKHDLYGMPSAPRFLFKPDNVSRLLEIPISTLPVLGRNMPCGGGGFFRLYPYWISQKAYRHLNQVEQKPGIFYFHPWEIDPAQPRQQNLPFKSRFRHYLNLDRMETRLVCLINDFAWDTMQNVFLRNQPEVRVVP
ncbi:MAG: polysaccharide deacetylase family protein [Methylomonas sp.]|nr:MAG: polysaccharide deacetylase family protein [Methylomonas sp.]PPD25592.1 MAG: polysaccharide deacetylase family protein [Methylomonas sp.]PPD36492.1 MAG: polysaccharide deacetylase family protein [Methylomonas sp.]PPD40987.1 MAG: polysaccharide deacetylase family protein [Methylomonas sp.]PPD53137.1 MAG: polysaccharide deacetylase family protein [Methylomonas sp.]